MSISIIRNGSGVTSAVANVPTAISSSSEIVKWVLIQETPVTASPPSNGLRICQNRGSNLGWIIQQNTSVERKPGFIPGPVTLNNVYVRHEDTSIAFNYIYAER